MSEMTAPSVAVADMRKTGAEHEVQPTSVEQKDGDKPEDTLNSVADKGEITTPDETLTVHDTIDDTMNNDKHSKKGSRTHSRPASRAGNRNHPARPVGAWAGQSATINKRPHKKEKKGILSSFLNAFIPCISPSKAFNLEDSAIPVKRAPSPNNRLKPAPKSKSSSVEIPKPETGQIENGLITLAYPDPLSSPSQPNAKSSSLTVPYLAPIDTSVAEAGFVPVIPPELSVTVPPTPSESTTTIIVPPTPIIQLLPDDETCGMTSGAVQAPGSTGEEHRVNVLGIATSGTDADGESVLDDSADNASPSTQALGTMIAISADDEEDEEARLIRQGGSGIPIGPDGKPRPLLPEVLPTHRGRKCLVLDMDETLLHGSFKLISHADFVIPVEIDFQWHNIYVIKRPGVEEFLRKMGEIYEVVVFTASVSKYADAVLDKLDKSKAITHRLFRESCYLHRGNYIKDLSRLGRPIHQTIILDNSPASYIFNPSNAVPVSSWFNDPHDSELTDLTQFLTDLCVVDDVRGILDGSV